MSQTDDLALQVARLDEAVRRQTKAQRFANVASLILLGLGFWDLLRRRVVGADTDRPDDAA